MTADLPGLLLGRYPQSKVVLVAAHPDDEVIGAGARLSHLPGLTIIHVTDGAPRNLYDAVRHGFADARSYARQRRRELDAALAEGAVSAELIELGFPDQTATSDLSRLTMALANRFARIRPDLILTHPYEGGHPDHDATAFAVAAAMDLVGNPQTVLAEFTSYHLRCGELRTGEFLANGGPEIVFELTPAEREMKRRMFDQFGTQREVLAPFRADTERFRLAPSYDFTRPPHLGELWYERFDWGTNGEQFRRMAARVADELEASAALAR